MWSLVVIVLQPDIHIGLQFLDRSVNFLPECSRIKFFLHCPVKTFTDTVCLWTPGLGLRVIDILISQVELILVVFSCTTLFGSSICEHSHQWDPVLVIKSENPIIQNICSNKSTFRS